MGEENTAIQALEKLAALSQREQRARRRWGVFFRLLFFGYVFFVTGWFWTAQDAKFNFEHAAIIEVEGVIFAGGDNNAERIGEQLRAAFAEEQVKGVVMKINSPGGSAVESLRIYKEMTRLRGEHPDKKIVAVVGDYCASGGYFIAAAADEIYAEKASIIGSIGVIFSGFGFVEMLEKLGVERRVQTAGKHKNFLDPFSPQKFSDTEHMRKILESVHVTFKQAVQDGRGDKLSTDAKIFSGAIFGGEESLQLGLIDGFGDVRYVTEEIIGVEETVHYESKEPLDKLLEKIPGALIGFFGKWGVPRLE